MIQEFIAVVNLVYRACETAFGQVMRNEEAQSEESNKRSRGSH